MSTLTYSCGVYTQCHVKALSGRVEAYKTKVFWLRGVIDAARLSIHFDIEALNHDNDPTVDAGLSGDMFACRFCRPIDGWSERDV